MKQSLSLTQKMLISLVAGLLSGFVFLFLRQYLLGHDQASVWQTINSLLFQDIRKSTHHGDIGLFFIVGQLFVNALQLIIIPMVFTSLVLAVTHISDTATLGRVSYKTLIGFLSLSIAALLFASTIALIAFKMNLFTAELHGLTSGSGKVASNVLLVVVNVIPHNLMAAFTNNGGVLAVVFLAIVVGLSINVLGDQIKILRHLIEEMNKIITLFLTFVINKFAPIAIYALLTRTFAIYGMDYLVPAASYFILTTIALAVFLIIGYALFIKITTGFNPIIFIKKISKVALFGFSTSSSAATLPVNMKTTIEELGADPDISSFVLPLGMTVNMNGTAIMQVIATVFIAGVAGYHVTFGSLILVSILALIASVGTPAAPGAGAVVLFTILTGMGFNNDIALTAYSLILAINRPIEMLVTSLNVVGDSSVAMFVSKSEGKLNKETFDQM